jgi:hypothetical protein
MSFKRSTKIGTQKPFFQIVIGELAIKLFLLNTVSAVYHERMIYHKACYHCKAIAPDWLFLPDAPKRSVKARATAGIKCSE